MSGFEDFIKWFTKDNITTTLFVLLVIAVFYVNFKVNDIDYRLQQTIMYHSNKLA